MSAVQACGSSSSQAPAPAAAPASAPAPPPASAPAPPPASASASVSASASASVSASSPPPASAPALPSSGIRTPVQLASGTPSATRFPEHLMHKNRLQEFAQRSNIALPMYQTVNEGHQHAPRFRSTVWVDGMSYTSQVTFPQRKAAEQDVARIALECLSKKFRDEGCPLVRENTTFCKTILNEYATKLNLEGPIYNTVRQEGLLPVFVSSVVFNGTKYTGDAARNKKEAEQLAARAVILSILGISGSGTMLSQIIKSKSKFYAAVQRKGLQCLYASTLDHREKEGAGPVEANNNETKVELPESSRLLSSCQEYQMAKQESSPEATKLPNVSLQPGSEQPTADGSSSKKRRKNKKKANKKSRLESPLPSYCISQELGPSCSVAQ